MFLGKDKIIFVTEEDQKEPPKVDIDLNDEEEVRGKHFILGFD